MIDEHELETFDPMMKAAIKELIEERKKVQDRFEVGSIGEAEEKEIYARLTTLKEGAMFLKEKAQRFNKLLANKKLAIEHEDYDVAKRLKIAIDRERV